MRSATSLSHALAQLGEAEPARALGQATLQRCRRKFGSDHPITLWAATGLTLALGQLGEVEPARTLGQDTLQRCHRVLGTEHPTTWHLTRATSSGHPLISDDAVAGHPDDPFSTWTYGTRAPRRENGEPPDAAA
jgi:hypothetical protein